MTTGGEYDRIWGTAWGDVQEFGPTHTHVRRLLFSLIKNYRFSSVLDAGCGNGVNMRFFLDRFPGIKQIAGFDISDVALRAAAKRCPQADLSLMDIQEEQLHERFDLVYCSDVLEHLENDGTALRNLFEMTGRFLLVNTLQGKMRRFEKKIGHVRN
jgi:trans-aconitate methyltransferase